MLEWRGHKEVTETSIQWAIGAVQCDHIPLWQFIFCGETKTMLVGRTRHLRIWTIRQGEVHHIRVRNWWENVCLLIRDRIWFSHLYLGTFHICSKAVDTLSKKHVEIESDNERNDRNLKSAQKDDHSHLSSKLFALLIQPRMTFRCRWTYAYNTHWCSIFFRYQSSFESW